MLYIDKKIILTNTGRTPRTDLVFMGAAISVFRRKVVKEKGEVNCTYRSCNRSDKSKKNLMGNRKMCRFFGVNSYQAS